MAAHKNEAPDSTVSLRRSDVHDFIETKNALYMLMFDVNKGCWVAWVTCPHSIAEIEYSEFARDKDARARLHDVYEQKEKRPLQ